MALETMNPPEDRVENAISCLLNDTRPLKKTLSADRLMSFKEVCQALSISKSSLRRIIDAGELRRVQLSKRRIGFRVVDVNEFVSSRCS